MKNTAIISIRDRGQGWQWKSIDILTADSSSFSCVLTDQVLECGWRKAEESSASALHWLVKLPEWLKRGSVFFMGEGCCLWNWTLWRFWGSWTAFQVSSSQEVTAFLALMWWIQGMEPVTLTAVGFARMTMWGPVQNWLNWFLFPIFNPYLISRKIGMNSIAQRNGCPF